MTLKYALTRSTIEPSKGTTCAAGLDLYTPDFNESFLSTFREKNVSVCKRNLFSKNVHITLGPGESLQIPLGIKFNIPKGYALIAFNKSGVSFKQSLVKLAEVIDSDYQGEVFVTMYNYSSVDTYIYPNQKIIQLILLETPSYTLEHSRESELYTVISERGDGSMGSTGLKYNEDTGLIIE